MLYSRQHEYNTASLIARKKEQVYTVEYRTFFNDVSSEEVNFTGNDEVHPGTRVTLL